MPVIFFFKIVMQKALSTGIVKENLKPEKTPFILKPYFKTWYLDGLWSKGV